MSPAVPAGLTVWRSGTPVSHHHPTLLPLRHLGSASAEIGRRINTTHPSTTLLSTLVSPTSSASQALHLCPIGQCLRRHSPSGFVLRGETWGCRAGLPINNPCLIADPRNPLCGAHLGPHGGRTRRKVPNSCRLLMCQASHPCAIVHHSWPAVLFICADSWHLLPWASSRHYSRMPILIDSLVDCRVPLYFQRRSTPIICLAIETKPMLPAQRVGWLASTPRVTFRALDAHPRLSTPRIGRSCTSPCCAGDRWSSSAK